MIDHNGNEISKGTFVVWPFSKSHMTRLHKLLALTGNFQIPNQIWEKSENSHEHIAWVKMQGDMA
jgi:hypothetical protein